MNKLEKKQFKEFFLNELINSFPKKAQPTILSNFSKHSLEISIILNTLRSNSENDRKMIDIGGGLGINCIILSKLYGYDTYLIDRFDEFDASHERVVGNDQDVINRLESFGVNVVREDFINNEMPVELINFDLITCFSVIEHFNFSPKKLIEDLSKISKKNGKIIVSTPNQVHLFNRIKTLLGVNTWEDFDYYYHSNPFFGHIREYTKAEMRKLITYSKNWEFVEIKSGNYPLDEYAQRLKHRNSKMGKLSFLLKPLKLLTITHSLRMHLFTIGKKP